MIVAGFGCRATTSLASLRAVFELARGTAIVDALATPADKAEILAPLAASLGLPLIPITDEMLRAIETPTRSPTALDARGVGSVAEAAALAACGPSARLLSHRRIAPDRMATCAIAEGTS